MYRLYYVLNYIFQDRQVTGEKTAHVIALALTQEQS